MVDFVLFQITEVLSLILTLLELPGKKDQIYALMLEPNMAELLYHLLTRKTFTVLLKEKVLRVSNMTAYRQAF